MLKRIIMLWGLSPLLWAEIYSTTKTQGPVSKLADMMSFVAVSAAKITSVAGMIMCLAAFYQYLKHRESPSSVGISQVIVLLVLGVALILMRYITVDS